MKPKYKNEKLYPKKNPKGNNNKLSAGILKISARCTARVNPSNCYRSIILT